MTFLADHLWQSTLVAVGAAVLGALYARHAARVRYAIWLVASLKFLVPFAWLTLLGSQVPWPADPDVTPPAAVSTVWAIGRPFSVDTDSLRPDSTRPIDPETSSVVPIILVAVWMAGSLLLGGRRWIDAREARTATRDARPLDTGREADALARLAGQRRPHVALRLSATRTSPCVVGILRPIVLWPEGISDQLTDAQVDAILAHELHHVRRHHNLAAAAHAVVEIVFWFHPLVWWIGTRLIEERERACDEDVLRSGTAPALYADGILRVCEFSVCAPAFGSARINGSTLMHRIEAIMSHQTPETLGWRRCALLVTAAAALTVGPVTLGAVNGSQAPSQAATGTITGVVTDQTGAVIAGTSVTARPSAGGATAGVAVTDSSGRYVITDLPAGEYEVRVERPGFKTFSARTSVQNGAEAVVHADLRVGSLSETITLRASSDPLPPSDTESKLVELLGRGPQTASEYLQLAALYYRQERFAESAAMTARAVELIREQAAAALGSVVPALPSSGGEIKEPRKIRDVKPVYPAAARAAQVSGRVEIEATIAEDGTIRDARVLRGVPLLDEAALGAVRQWLFTPTLLNGVPVEVVMHATVTFELPK